MPGRFDCNYANGARSGGANAAKGAPNGFNAAQVQADLKAIV
jgi:hypothetical protein